jgi:type VI secretion system protein ImpG
MGDRLETRYEGELDYIRRLGSEFARRRPKIADRLLMDHDTGVSDDPHVERLIEAFAFLTARLRLKLDDEFPELTDALIGILYPHYLAPIPSLAIVQFEVDPEQGKLTTGHTIAAKSKLYSREIQGMPCRFRTAYPVTLWPVELTAAGFHTAPYSGLVVPPPASAAAPALLRLELRATGGTSFAELQMNSLRFFLSGDDPTVRTLHELLLNHVIQVMIRPGTATHSPPPVVLPAGCVRQVGFERDEWLLPYGSQSQVAYRLLTEYFAFPSKFLFFDLTGLQATSTHRYGDVLEVFFFLDRAPAGLETRVKIDTFRLGCCPIVNLFDQPADPIALSQSRHEYQVIPDARFHRGMEVYSIDSVQSTNVDTQETVRYRPFYSFQHGGDESQQTFWYPARRPSPRGEEHGTEMYLSLVDLNFNPRLPPAEVLTLQTTCTNRDLPVQLRTSGGEHWEFQLDGQAPLRRITPLVGPTAPARMPIDEGRWRLISHLSLNHLSIVDAADGAEALREILRLYDFVKNKVSSQHIAGIQSVSSRRGVAPITDGTGAGFCRGVEVTIDFDEEKYAGSGVFLFAMVLERFLGLYASLNSATRLVATSKQRQGIIKRWPYRAGDKTLL